MSKSKRLIIFTESYAFGGDQQYISDIAKVALELFDEIYYVGNPEAFKNEKVEKLFSGIKFYPVNFVSRSRLRWKLRKLPKILRAVPLLLASLCHPIFFIVNFFVLRAVLKKTKPDVVYTANGGYPGSSVVSQMAWLSKIFFRCKVLYSIVSVPMPCSKLKFGLNQFFNTKLWGSVDIILVNGQIIGDELSRLYGVSDLKIRTVTNGVDIKDLLHKTDAGSGLTIGTISRLSPGKGVEYLVHAFIELAKKHQNIRLRIAGAGEQLDFLQSLVASASLSDRAEFLGFYVGDPHEFLESLDIFVLASLHEGLPYSLLEAMRAGCAVVTTDVGAVTEVVVNEESALIVQPGNILEITEGLERLINNKSLRVELGEEARALFEKNHTKEVMASRVKELFLGMIHKI